MRIDRFIDPTSRRRDSERNALRDKLQIPSAEAPVVAVMVLWSLELGASLELGRLELGAWNFCQRVRVSPMQ